MEPVVNLFADGDALGARTGQGGIGEVDDTFGLGLHRDDLDRGAGAGRGIDPRPAHIAVGALGRALVAEIPFQGIVGGVGRIGKGLQRRRVIVIIHAIVKLH